MAFDSRGRFLRMTLPRGVRSYLTVRRAESVDVATFEALDAAGDWIDAATSVDVAFVRVPVTGLVSNRGPAQTETVNPPPEAGGFVYLTAAEPLFPDCLLYTSPSPRDS